MVTSNKATVGKNVATTPIKAVATISEHEKAQLAKMAAEDAGTGFEEATRESYATPFLVVLQDLSPQVKSKMPGYIKGAEPGMIFDTVSQKFYPNVRVIPCHYSQAVIEWIPRDKGGGFVAAHSVTDGAKLLAQAVREKSKNVLPNGHELQLTAQHFVLLLNEDGTATGALIAMKSTQLKYSRRWMTSMKAAPFIEVAGAMHAPAMFDYSYKLDSMEEANEDGSWWSWDITDRQRVVSDKSNFTATEAAIYRQAREFRGAMAAGRAKVDWESAATHDKTGTTPGDLDEDNEIPGA